MRWFMVQAGHLMCTWALAFHLWTTRSAKCSPPAESKVYNIFVQLAWVMAHRPGVAKWSALTAIAIVSVDSLASQS